MNLITKNQANKTTAKAALTQMLSVVNQRMEVHDSRIKSLGPSTMAFTPEPSTEGLPGSSRQSIVSEINDTK